jgi:hypothetical protein
MTDAKYRYPRRSKVPRARNERITGPVSIGKRIVCAAALETDRVITARLSWAAAAQSGL